MQILAGANEEALAVAAMCGAQFVRAEGFVFSHVADEGLMAEASAAKLLRFRRSIGAEHIHVVADVKKKHSAHAITSDVSIAETVHAAEFFRVDGVIITGTSTASPTGAIESLSVLFVSCVPTPTPLLSMYMRARSESCSRGHGSDETAGSGWKWHHSGQSCATLATC